MAFALPQPTPELVRAVCKKFDEEEVLVESALTQLFTTFPRNLETAHVLLKVIVLNRLYATNIFAVTPIARQIANPNIDERLAAGDSKVVDQIATAKFGDKTRNILSFATKYCNWHNPTAYPIYDSRVDTCLWAYQKQNRFSEFARNDLRTFATFFKVVNDFRNYYGLTEFTYKQLDKFLWETGKDIANATKRRVAAAA